jgi:hypothetical protein
MSPGSQFDELTPDSYDSDIRAYGACLSNVGAMHATKPQICKNINIIMRLLLLFVVLVVMMPLGCGPEGSRTTKAGVGGARRRERIEKLKQGAQGATHRPPPKR